MSSLDDSSRRSSAESQSSSGTANSHRSSNSSATQQQKKSRPSTAPVKNVKPHSSSSSSHRASTAPTLTMSSADDASSSNVRVVARLRPLSTKEKNEHSSESIRANVHSSSIAVPDINDGGGGGSNNNNTRKFEFDAVFAPNSTQEEVYQKTCGDMISKSIFRGFNATILAYGQTGSGKTYTMGTDYSCGGGDDNNSSRKPSSFAATTTSSSNNNNSLLLAPPDKSIGVIGRAVHDLFSTRNSLPNGRDRVKVEMSYLEIYNEQAIDLLSDDDSEEASLLQVRDSKTEGVVVQNLNSFVVTSPSDVATLMERAAAKRATGSTQMNSVSSRSHAICTLTVTIAPLLDNNETSSYPRNDAAAMMRAKLTLVDLAGSERIKRTGAEGARMKEGININKGEFFESVRLLSN